MSSLTTTSAADATAMTTSATTSGRHWISISLILLALVAVRWVAHSFGGGLWRDEIHSVNMAIAPCDDLFYVLTQDSFPVLWQVLLRSWIGIFGSTDESVRALGLLIGLAVIPALWWMTRQFDLSFPWWSMLLLGLDPTFVIFGGEARGYSLGIVTLLILIGVSWNTLKQPTAWRWAGLTAAALLAVQSSYTNCFLLAATFIGCGVVGVYRGRYRVCVGFAIIGILAAVSMLPYALYVLPRLSKILQPFLPTISGWIRVSVFRRTFFWGGITRAVVWWVLGAIATREICRRACPWTKKRPSQTDSERNLAIFAITFFWVGTIGFWWYMEFLGAHTASWYYLPFMTLLAVTTDIGIQLWLRHQSDVERRAFRLTMIAVLLVCAEICFSIPYRLTAVDLVARDLTGRVRKGDLVLVSPWYFGIPFDRYYSGPADWMTFPDVDHDRQHNGYIELYQRVMPLPPELAIKTELEKIDAVLLAGGSIWWVGPKPELEPGKAPFKLTGVPDTTKGWSEAAYFKMWQQMAIARMQAIGVTGIEHPVRKPRLINVLEDPPVFVFQPKRSELKISDGGDSLPR